MQDTSRNDRSLELRFVRTASKISRWNLNAFEGVLHLHLYIVHLTRKKKLSHYELTPPLICPGL